MVSESARIHLQMDDICVLNHLSVNHRFVDCELHSADLSTDRLLAGGSRRVDRFVAGRRVSASRIATEAFGLYHDVGT